MKWFTRFFNNINVMDTEFLATDSVLPDFSSVVVVKSQYIEHHKEYVANYFDLTRLIRNECKSLGRKGNKVVWMITQSNSGRFKVSYAVLSEAATKAVQNGWRFVLPETWLLYNSLKVNDLYQINSEVKYWALLNESGELNITVSSGLMSSARFFLDALGVNQTSQHQTLELASVLEQKKLPLPAQQLIGVLVLSSQISSKSSAELNIRWKLVSVGLCAVLALYMAVMSGVLTWQEQSLEAKLEVNQASANEMFAKQQKVEKQLELVASYHDLYVKHPSSVSMIKQLSKDLTSAAVVQNLQISRQLIQITGNTSSATELLAKLSSSGAWSEVRFDNQVQRRSGKEHFTISAVYVGSTDGMPLTGKNIAGGSDDHTATE